MIGGGGRECQWSVGQNGKRHDCPEDRMWKREKLSSGRCLARGEHYFPSLEDFPFSFPRRGWRAYVYCALRTTAKHLSSVIVTCLSYVYTICRGAAQSSAW
jgi:hypothetical protein